MKLRQLLLLLFSYLAIASVCVEARAQGALGKPIYIDAGRKPLGEVMNELERQGAFVFSYNSSYIRKDSIVSLRLRDATVRDALHQLFGDRFGFRQAGKYIILERNVSEQYWYVSGYVTDVKTSQPLPNASVYEPDALVAALTNDQGYFRLRMKNRYQSTALRVTKEWYEEQSVSLMPGTDQDLTVHLTPRVFELSPVVVTRYSRIEGTWYGRMFMSSKDKFQSLNLGKFFVDKPFQFSVIPGVGTHGKMASQVTNKLSLNLLGGYTAAVNGLEIGCVFNIVKKDAKYVQLAGFFNIVGGQARGVQAAGLFNQVLDTVKGVQLGGLGSIVEGQMVGVQAGGFYNRADRQMEGMQLAGFANQAREVRGVQAAGFANLGRTKVRGLQLSGFLNYTHKLKGIQIGILNIADSSEGVSLGLFNIVIDGGYHKLSIYGSDALDLNVAVKTGTPKLYTVLLAGANADEQRSAYGFGAGLGSEVRLGRYFGLSPEVTAQQLYLGDWDHLNLLSRLQLNLEWRPSPYFMIFGGPAYNIYYSEQAAIKKGYEAPAPTSGIADLGGGKTGWLGWQAGISIF